MSLYQCYKAECVDKSFSKLSSLLSHIRALHSHEPNFSITCGIQGCPNPQRTCKVWSTYTSHLSRCHKEELEKEEENQYERLPSPPDLQDPRLLEDGARQQLETCESKEAITRNLANFIVKTQETNKLAEKAIFDILDETCHFVERNVNNFKKKLIACIESAGVQTADLDGLDELLKEESEFAQAYQRLDNNLRKLKEYLMDEMSLVVG